MKLRWYKLSVLPCTTKSRPVYPTSVQTFVAFKQYDKQKKLVSKNIHLACIMIKIIAWLKSTSTYYCFRLRQMGHTPHSRLTYCASHQPGRSEREAGWPADTHTSPWPPHCHQHPAQRFTTVMAHSGQMTTIHSFFKR